MKVTEEKMQAVPEHLRKLLFSLVTTAADERTRVAQRILNKISLVVSQTTDATGEILESIEDLHSLYKKALNDLVT